jgi:hypothetical protein
MKIARRVLAALSLACVLSAPLHAQTQMQFPTAPWGGYAPSRVQCGWLESANFNVTTDQAIPISVPGYTYMVDSIVISNPSVSLTTAAGGFYSAASKAGVAIVANTQVYTSLTSNTASTTGNAMLATLATAGNTTAFLQSLNTIYLSLTTGQGSAATADVRVYCRPLYPTH